MNALRYSNTKQHRYEERYVDQKIYKILWFANVVVSTCYLAIISIFI